MPTQTSGYFTYTNWQERKVISDETGPPETSPGEPSNSGKARPSLAHASVTNAFTGGIEAAGTNCEYTIVYVTEKSGTFTGMEMLTGRLDGREGTLVLKEHGSFDAEGAVHCAFEVVPGTGTNELTGLSGTGSFTAQRGEQSVPYTFDYELA